MKNIKNQIQNVVWVYHAGPYPIIVVFNLIGDMTFVPTNNQKTFSDLMIQWNTALEDPDSYSPELRAHLQNIAQNITDHRPTHILVEAPTAHERMNAIKILQKP